MGIGYLSSCSAVHWLLVVTDEPSIKCMSYAFWAESQKQKTEKSTKSNMHGQQQNQSNFRCAVGSQGQFIRLLLTLSRTGYSQNLRKEILKNAQHEHFI